MKKILCALTIVCMLFPMSGFAQTGHDGSVPIKFIDLEEWLIEGEHKKPQVLYTNAREKVKFERLLNLKRSFLPKLRATASDAALR